jgi:hypothetical protein
MTIITVTVISFTPVIRQNLQNKCQRGHYLGQCFQWIILRPTRPWNLYLWFMVFNATFNNISVISWRSILLVEEIRVPGENHWPVASHWQTFSHNNVSSTPPHERFELTTLVVIDTDCTGSCKSNYHTIMTTAVPFICTNLNLHIMPNYNVIWLTNILLPFKGEFEYCIEFS